MRWTTRGTVEPAFGCTPPGPWTSSSRTCSCPTSTESSSILELRRAYPAVKIIVISGGDSTGRLDMRTQAQLLGAHRTFPKPLQTQELLNAVRELLAP